MSTGPTVWREPAEESVGLYPKLTVLDNRQSGSINVGPSRLPLWSFTADAVKNGWEAVERGWSPTEHYGFTEDDYIWFLCNLLNVRGEFGRLLLVLANAERCDATRGLFDSPWWRRKGQRRKVLDQLHRCIDALGDAS